MATQQQPSPIDKAARTMFHTSEKQSDDSDPFPISKELEPAFNQREAELADTLGETSAQRASRHKEFLDTVRPTGDLARSIGRRLFDLTVDADLAAIRGQDDEEQLASRIRRDGEETRQQLAGVYGRDEAERLLALAQKWVKGQPKLHALLGKRGIGSRKDIVVPILEHLRRIGWKG